MTLIEQMDEIVLHVKALADLNKKMSGPVMLCGHSEPRMQVYQGIQKMAEAVGAELKLPKGVTDHPVASFSYKGVEFHQLGDLVKPTGRRYKFR